MDKTSASNLSWKIGPCREISVNYCKLIMILWRSYNHMFQNYMTFVISLIATFNHLSICDIRAANNNSMPDENNKPECLISIGPNMLSLWYNSYLGYEFWYWIILNNHDCVNTCTLSYYHPLIGSMTFLPLFKVKSSKMVICCLSLTSYVL